MQARQSGFTLVEVIAVLLVLAILAGLAGVRLRPGGGSDALQATAHELASRCRAARAAAIRRGADQIVVIDIAGRVVSGSEAARPLSHPRDHHHPDRHQRGREALASRSPASASTPTAARRGAWSAWKSGRKAYEIRVNWFTGRVSVEAAT